MCRTELQKLENNIISKLEINKCRRLKRNSLEEVILNSFTYLGNQPPEVVVKELTDLFERYTLTGKLTVEDIESLRNYRLDYDIVVDVFELIFRNMIAFKKLSDSALVRINLNWEYGDNLGKPYSNVSLEKVERNKVITKEQIEDYLDRLERCEEDSTMKYSLLKLLKIMRWKCV